MAELSDADRKRIWRGLMRFWSNLREPLGTLNKSDLKAAVDATDNWIESNQASFNSAIPQPAGAELTADQKTLLFVAVALMRRDIDLLRKVFGEVD